MLRKANPLNAYAQVEDVASKIQYMIEASSDKIEREESFLKQQMMSNPKFRSLKNQIDSDMYDIYELAKALEKKAIMIQKL